MMASLTINCNITGPLPLRTGLLGALLFILHQSAPKLDVLETKLLSLDSFHLHKATYKLKALSGGKKKIPAHNGKIQQFNLHRG